MGGRLRGTKWLTGSCVCLAETLIWSNLHWKCFTDGEVAWVHLKSRCISASGSRVRRFIEFTVKRTPCIRPAPPPTHPPLTPHSSCSSAEPLRADPGSHWRRLDINLTIHVSTWRGHGSSEGAKPQGGHAGEAPPTWELNPGPSRCEVRRY